MHTRLYSFIQCDSLLHIIIIVIFFFFPYNSHSIHHLSFCCKWFVCVLRRVGWANISISFCVIYTYSSCSSNCISIALRTQDWRLNTCFLCRCSVLGTQINTKLGRIRFGRKLLSQLTFDRKYNWFCFKIILI